MPDLPASSRPDFSWANLRRFPDVEADNLFAVDASDRLILDEAAPAIARCGRGRLVVLEDRYGALTLGAAALAGATGIRVHQDGLSGERALARNAADASLSSCYRSLDLGADLLAGARVVLLQLPRSLAALDELAGAIARYAEPEAIVFAGGRVKHMTVAMNEVLRRHFTTLTVSPARQKSRVLVAQGPRDGPHIEWPHREWHADLGLTVCAHGAAFAGTAVDVGTRFLLEFLDQTTSDAVTAIDLGCGTGVLAAVLARRRPGLRLIATDQSAAAVASARATMAANGVADRVRVLRDDALASQPDASADLVLLNPPFHIGATVHAGIAVKLFAEAARVLRPDGELWCVWNSHLGYRPALARIVGTTRQVGRNAKFTVTASTRNRPAGRPGRAVTRAP